MLAVAGRAASPRHRSRTRLAAVLAIAIGLLAVTLLSYRATPAAAIVIGSKNFTEQVILGELLAQTIERETGLAVERRLNLGGTLVCDAALTSGDIDLYVEYTGTALTALFHEALPTGQPPSGVPGEVMRRVRDRYAERGITVLPGLGFNNTFAILVRTRDARDHRLVNISDLSRVAPTWRAGFGYEFLERPDGLSGLTRTYGLRFRDAPRVMDLNLIYRSLAAGEIDVTAGDATSGLIEALDLTTLADDRGYFPPYDAVPVVRTSTLLRFPEVDKALRALAGRISESAMRRMNHQVDGQRLDARDVARHFLEGL
jgi:glycine betaine/choline ABC-type transport system substrate-binding protein